MGPLATDVALDVLQTSDIIVLGRMPYSSNATFLVDLSSDDDGDSVIAQGIYKPARGERPLWDFPHGLWKREVAAFELSDHLGWHLVPPTVEREGPLGPGSLQLFVPHDMEQHYLTLREDPRHRHAFERLCVFDIVSNNTDRKSGHCLHRHRRQHLGHRQRFVVPRRIQAAHGAVGLRRRAIPRDIIADVELLLDEGAPESVTSVLDDDRSRCDVDARSRDRLQRLLPARYQREALALAARVKSWTS